MNFKDKIRVVDIMLLKNEVSFMADIKFEIEKESVVISELVRNFISIQ